MLPGESQPGCQATTAVSGLQDRKSAGRRRGRVLGIPRWIVKTP